MADEPEAAGIEVGKEKKPRRMRRTKVKNPSTGGCVAQRDKLNAYMDEILEDLRDTFYMMQTTRNVYPATQEGVEMGGKYLAAVLVDRGLRVGKFMKKLLVEAQSEEAEATG